MFYLFLENTKTPSEVTIEKESSAGEILIYKHSTANKVFLFDNLLPIFLAPGKELSFLSS